MRRNLTFDIKNALRFREQLFQWLQQHSHACWLDNNDWSSGWAAKRIAAAGSTGEITPGRNALQALESIGTARDWLFGSLSYDLKNEIEQLHSNHPDGVQFPVFHFFRPEYIFLLDDDKRVTVLYPESYREDAVKKVIDDICNVTVAERATASPLQIQAKITKEEYHSGVMKLKHHIHIGDIYEVNFCQEFFAKDAVIDPADVYTRLNRISKAPFSAYYKQHDKYLLCASPERFIARQGSRIISQPIKGTARRGSSTSEDEQLKAELASSEKERSENVMIVDLVRNDLSRIAKRGSVKVDELFGIYTFEQVHQMISTVSAELRDDISFADIIKAAFPMGSMTGAPKVRAMQLIEEYETSKRGLYSGTVGYIDPDGNFDLNVVIRSILYNAAAKHLSFTVGSAITDRSEAEKEYDECLVKAAAMLRVLQDNVHA